MLTSLTRRTLATFVLGATLAACSPAGSDTADPTDGTPTIDGFASGFMSMGPEDAPVQIIEYASVTCGHCKTFHDTAVPVIKSRVAAGDVYFSFREFPTAPANVAMAGFAMARCAGADQYFNVIDDLFDNQMGILSAARNGTAQTALETVAARHGLDAEAFAACIGNQDVVNAIIDVVKEGEERGVNSTPAVFFNGERLTQAVDYTAEGMTALIDAALAEANGDVADGEATDETTTPETETQ